MAVVFGRCVRMLVLLSVVVLLVLAVGVDVCDGAWIEPTILGPDDRIAYIRPRKTGSTSLVSFFRQAGWCENHCVPGLGVCAECLYTWDCSRCPELMTTYKQCGECSHLMLPLLRSRFSNVQRALIDRKGYGNGRMYTVMLLRDPVDRLLSFFFFVRAACPYRGSEELAQEAQKKLIPLPWLINSPEDLQAAICDGDFETFLKLTPVHNEMADLLVGISYFDPNITSQQCDNALMRLEEMAVVLLNEEMEDGLHMLKATLIRPPEAPPPPRVPESQLFQQHVRASRSDPLRDAIRANATLVHMLKQYNHCDERLYARAVQIFHEAKQRLLG
ncbi:hypothetical protein PTSG_02245 [Salpingoeca rosetta]|uniref:Sulfotransferase domain-containing protein n=1 Tax=Salpingoeca rosetta (strain ATCC 50818 / BSB-021) TaxID=946362 RepID=F2U1M4_SALR5|nr:uncharacterized protein PTSG_02245 [Salpingoeca rosetta]EGD81526.1 hypothetical protein PTSG_02245 [Salpingoeca rosetta]|eukprot:XP_004996730.1 hypothetical protein PTSG_02245 [Salpingoeca rosetta]